MPNEPLKTRLKIAKDKLKSSDSEEKIFGLAAKNYVIQNLPVGSNQILKTVIDDDGNDVKGKFGRILGDFVIRDETMLAEQMICLLYTSDAADE